MKRIGVRELRQQASRYLREVERGETIEVTDRGRPVARLTPVPDDDEDIIERLAAAGRLTRARGDLLEALEHLRPIKPKPGMPSSTKLLEQDRADRLP